MIGTMERKGWIGENLPAGDGVPLGLSVDGEGLVLVSAPDLGDVGFEVVREEAVVEHDAVVGAQGTNVPTRGIAYDQGGPAGVIGGVLGCEARANGVETVGSHARNMLGSSGGIGQG